MKFLIKICTLIAILTFISCDNYLDVEPKGKVIPKTIKDYDLLLNGGWANIYLTSDVDPLFLTADDFISKNNRTQLGDIDVPNNETVLLYKWDKNLFTNNNSQKLWNFPYKNIFTYNLVIEKIDEAEETPQYTAADRKTIKAEALVGRAYEYWLLVNTFGKQYSEASASENLGVPLVTSANIAQSLPKRASVKEVYDFIVKDVTDAINDLPQQAKNRARPSKGTGYALLARIYLSMNNYIEASKNATLAIAEKGTIGDYNNLERYSKEGPYTSEAYMLRTFQGFSGYTKGVLSKEMLTLYDIGNDLRVRETTFLSADGEWIKNKNTGEWEYVSSGDFKNNGNLTINHAPSVPEMYLIRAECNARKGNLIEVINDLNMLRVKRMIVYTALTLDDIPNKEIALTLVLKERRKEMILTGLRLFDLKRLNLEPALAKTITHTIKTDNYTAGPGSNKLVLPIPGQVLSFNPNMKQNVRD
jgi:hypothetical protein